MLQKEGASERCGSVLLLVSQRSGDPESPWCLGAPSVLHCFLPSVVKPAQVPRSGGAGAGQSQEPGSRLLPSVSICKFPLVELGLRGGHVAVPERSSGAWCCRPVPHRTTQSCHILPGSGVHSGPGLLRWGVWPGPTGL